jgi:hypothetical protein
MPKLAKPSPDVLDKIDRIRVVSWEWNEVAETVGLTPGAKSIGVIAQELAEVFPELVVTTEQDGFKAVNYASLAAIAIAGVQQLRRQVEALQALQARGGRTARVKARRTAPTRKQARHAKR